MIVQNNGTSASDVNGETHVAASVDDLSSTAVTMEGFLNYKATHHEGKVSIVDCCLHCLNI